jgi:hypothetical protein
MSAIEPAVINEPAAHKKFAVDCFNAIWKLFDKQERTPDDNEMMIHLAHTSLYHWLQVGEPINEQRGEWMLARVYTTLEDKEKSLHHARRCMTLTEKNNFKDFDLAYSYECLARACALNKQTAECGRYFALAKRAGEEIAEKGDRDLFTRDLNSGQWFGEHVA